MAQYSLRPDTREALIEKHQTSDPFYKGGSQSVETQFTKMIAGLRLWKVAEGRKIRKSKTVIRKIRKLSKVQVEYPPELLAARRRSFVEQVAKKVPESSAKDSG